MYEHTHDNKTLPYPDNLITEIGVPKVTPRTRKQYLKIISNNILTEREADILSMYYDKNMTLRDIGEQYGVTRERIRQLMNIAVNKLTKCSAFINADRNDKYFEFVFSGNSHANVIITTIAHSKRAAENHLKSSDGTSIWYDLCTHVESKEITEESYIEQLRDRVLYPKKYKY